MERSYEPVIVPDDVLTIERQGVLSRLGPHRAVEISYFPVGLKAQEWSVGDITKARLN